MRVTLVVAPKGDLHTLLADVAKALVGARVLGILGEDVMSGEPRDVSYRRPVLIGVPGRNLASVFPYRPHFEELAETHGSWEILLLSREDEPQSLRTWLEHENALSRYEQMIQYVMGAGSLLEYVNQAPPTRDPRLLWVQERGKWLRHLGM